MPTRKRPTQRSLRAAHAERQEIPSIATENRALLAYPTSKPREGKPVTLRGMLANENLRLAEGFTREQVEHEIARRATNREAKGWLKVTQTFMSTPGGLISSTLALR